MASNAGIEQMGHPTKKVNANVITKTLDQLGLSVIDFANSTGQSPSAVHAWIREGKAPAWVVPACSGLLSSAGQKAAADDVVLLVKAPKGEKETLLKLLAAVGATFSAI